MLKIFFAIIFYLLSIWHAPSICAKEAYCSLPFGTVIGQSFLTAGYNNCGDEQFEYESHFIRLNGVDELVFTGLKWQCVEYARRWLIENKGVTFDSVDFAFQISDLLTFKDVYTNEELPTLLCQNKASNILPAVGDLLIYNNERVYTGHVAVIVEVAKDFIAIAEQNYDDVWETHDYSRRLPLVQDADRNFCIQDEAVLGWVRHVKK